MKHATLSTVDWPDFGRPEMPAPPALAEMEGRLVAIRAAMQARGLDRLVIYGDREHSANILWATGFDPRFEEALFIIGPDGPPALVAGNECLPYTGISPLVAAGQARVLHCASLSLISQPREGLRLDQVIAREVAAGERVGTVGWKLTGSGVDPHDTFRPFLRGGNADLNMTAAMAFTFALLWFFWAITENGLKGFLSHIFAPKGKFSGIMSLMMLGVFGFVGILEVISILFRPVALSFRLYGNIFAGENILENMMFMGGKWLAWLPPLPFYFLELLVGLIQALVFMLLTAVFLKLICDHGDHDEKEGEHSH